MTLLKTAILHDKKELFTIIKTAIYHHKNGYLSTVLFPIAIYHKMTLPYYTLSIFTKSFTIAIHQKTNLYNITCHIIPPLLFTKKTNPKQIRTVHHKEGDQPRAPGCEHGTSKQSVAVHEEANNCISSDPKPEDPGFENSFPTLINSFCILPCLSLAVNVVGEGYKTA